MFIYGWQLIVVNGTELTRPNVTENRPQPIPWSAFCVHAGSASGLVSRTQSWPQAHSRADPNLKKQTLKLLLKKNPNVSTHTSVFAIYKKWDLRAVRKNRVCFTCQCIWRAWSSYHEQTHDDRKWTYSRSILFLKSRLQSDPEKSLIGPWISSWGLFLC